MLIINNYNIVKIILFELIRYREFLMSLNSIGILFNTPNLQCLIIFFKVKE